MNFDMNMLMLIMQGKNPQQMILNYLQLSQLSSTPIGLNLMSLAKKGDYGALELMARNICLQKGLDFDELSRNFKLQLGMR